MQISFCNSNDKYYQKMLNNLLKPIFFDFQFWYNLDLWDGNYESYSIMQNGEIISNICVFKANIICNGRQNQALSIGAVATKNEHRGNGYSRLLMEHIIEKYDNMPMYLSANKTVIDFYPRFGFERVYEKLPIAQYKIHNTMKANMLCFDDLKVWNYVYKRVNFSQRLDCLNTKSVNLFHIYWGYLKDCIYDIPELDTIIIAKKKDTTLNIIGVFSTKEICFAELAKHLPFANVEKITFGFMPYWDDLKYEMMECKTDPLFARGLQCGLGDFKFPELSIT